MQVVFGRKLAPCCRFAENYRRLYNKSGWIPRAFVNYYAGRKRTETSGSGGAVAPHVHARACALPSAFRSGLCPFHESYACVLATRFAGAPGPPPKI